MIMEMTSTLAGRGMAQWRRCAQLRRLKPTSPCSSRSFSRGSFASLEPPDVHRLAETARISLSPQEVEEFSPKIRQVVDWFGQLQSVDLESIDPSLRVDTVASANMREDVAESFDNRKAMLEAIPSFEDSYIKVPKVLNKE